MSANVPDNWGPASAAVEAALRRQHERQQPQNPPCRDCDRLRREAAYWRAKYERYRDWQSALIVVHLVAYTLAGWALWAVILPDVLARWVAR